MKDVLAGPFLAGGKRISARAPHPRSSQARGFPSAASTASSTLRSPTASTAANPQDSRAHASTRAMSLARHVTNGWRHLLCRELGEFIDVVPAAAAHRRAVVPGHGPTRSIQKHLHARAGGAPSPRG